MGRPIGASALVQWRRESLKQACVAVFKALWLQSHRQDTFTLSTDPSFIEKLRDVVGRYRDLPTNAIVLCVDERSQCQAFENGHSFSFRWG
jgi:hypothetical protein